LPETIAEVSGLNSTYNKLSRQPLKRLLISTDMNWWAACRISWDALRLAWWRTCAWKTGVCTGCGRSECDARCSCGCPSRRL